MPPQPSDSETAAAIARLADEIAGLRTSLAQLTADNARLQQRLESSETARADLLAQSEHLLELLARSRREARELKGEAD